MRAAESSLGRAKASPRTDEPKFPPKPPKGVTHPIASHLSGIAIPVCPIHKGRPLARAWGEKCLAEEGRSPPAAPEGHRGHPPGTFSGQRVFDPETSGRSVSGCRADSPTEEGAGRRPASVETADAAVGPRVCRPAHGLPPHTNARNGIRSTHPYPASGAERLCAPQRRTRRVIWPTWCAACSTR